MPDCPGLAAPGDDCSDDPGKGGTAVHTGANDSCATPGVEDNCDAKVDGPGALGCTPVVCRRKPVRYRQRWLQDRAAGKPLSAKTCVLGAPVDCKAAL